MNDVLPLRASVIRASVPARVRGRYLLWDTQGPRYAGRSDTCLRRRLLQHARERRSPYFVFDVLVSRERAFIAECGAFHALREQLANKRHPGHPHGTRMVCPFCYHNMRATLRLRERAAPGAECA